MITAIILMIITDGPLLWIFNFQSTALSVSTIFVIIMRIVVSLNMMSVMIMLIYYIHDHCDHHDQYDPHDHNDHHQSSVGQTRKERIKAGRVSWAKNILWEKIRVFLGRPTDRSKCDLTKHSTGSWESSGNFLPLPQVPCVEPHHPHSPSHHPHSAAPKMATWLPICCEPPTPPSSVSLWHKQSTGHQVKKTHRRIFNHLERTETVKNENIFAMFALKNIIIIKMRLLLYCSIVLRW